MNVRDAAFPQTHVPVAWVQQVQCAQCWGCPCCDIWFPCPLTPNKSPSFSHSPLWSLLPWASSLFHVDFGGLRPQAQGSIHTWAPGLSGVLTSLRLSVLP